MNSVLSVSIASKTDKTCYLGRDLTRRSRTSSPIPQCIRANRAIYVTKLSLCAGHLVLLAGDVSINPGPLNNNPTCAYCMKCIRSNQPRAKVCHLDYHFKCLDVDFDLNKSCRLCRNALINSQPEAEESYIPTELAKILELRGFKIVHQNIQSLRGKIDQLRFLLHELKSGIQLLTLSETWIKPETPDKEYEIPGYMLVRKDSEANCGGVAVYARNDLVVSRREDLEISDVEGLWLEIAMPKSRSFLVGAFYNPPPPCRRNFMIRILLLNWIVLLILLSRKIKR